MVLVDTNILLHAVNEDAPEHASSRAALESLANGGEPWVLTWTVVYEFLRVATHPRVFPKPLSIRDAYSFIARLLECDSCATLTETDGHLGELQQSLTETHRLSGNLVHDLHLAVLMREHGVKDILTLDSDFKSFPWVRIREFSD